VAAGCAPAASRRAAASVDARVDRLPRLESLGLIRRAAADLTGTAGPSTRLIADADAA
jgi:hypothetical protein